MDIHCSACKEPWDTFFLWHELISETDLSESEARVWLALPPTKRLQPAYREAFASVMWEFGESILDVRHCPACPDHVLPDPEQVAAKQALVSLLGDDEDGIAATMEDYGL